MNNILFYWNQKFMRVSKHKPAYILWGNKYACVCFNWIIFLFYL